MWQPSRNSSCTSSSAGDSRISSVPPLNASPSTPSRLPRKVHNTLRTLRRNRCRCSSLIRITSSSSRKSYPLSFSTARNAIRSLGKHDPPYPIPGFINRDPIRESVPIPSLTCSTFAPTDSQIDATALIKEIFIARNALEACLISSALFVLVTINRGGVLAASGRRIGSVPNNDGADPLARVHRNRALLHHHLVLVHAPGNFPRHRLHIRQIRVAALGRRCPDRDEHYLALPRGRLQIARKLDALSPVPRQQLGQKSFMNRHLVVPECRDF